jgi:hypothetical protein
MIWGYIYKGEKPPDTRAVCDTPKQFFRLPGN